MSSTTAVLVVLCACLAVGLAQQRRGFTNKYDNIDVDKVLSSRRLVTNYVQCLTDKKTCSPEGSELKKVLPEAIRTKCGKCSESQRTTAVKVIRKLQKDYPAEWKLLTDKWDPKGQLIREFEQDLARRRQG